MSDNKIIIDLSQTDTKSFDDPIQADAKASFEKHINNILINIKKNEKNTTSRIDRVHNTILINGKRGMGKTSFILSIENAKKTDSYEKILEHICTLGIIDPTLIETKEHVFLNIITLIKDRIDDHIQCDKCDQSNSKYKNWKESLRNLSGGLSMLDEVGSDHLQDSMWDSPELILEKGLSNAKQGYKLEENFHKFVDESLKILEKDAFFLILDDIDTSLAQGIAILETLRKYLTSRKLIIAMLGDIDLYSTLVRQLQWTKMDSKNILHKYEFPENKERYSNQIEHLEEQYLTKILKPENRIDLQNLLALKSKLVIDNIHNDFSIYVKTMINYIYFTKDGDSSEYENTLLTQSTRSVLQILQAWDQEEELNTNFIDRFKHTFYTTLKKKLGTHNLIEMPQKEKLLNLLSAYLLKENISRDSHLVLTPTFAKEDDNIAMLYLNMITNYLLTPKEYLSYFIKIGYAYEGYISFNTKQDHDQFIDNIVLDSNELLSITSEKIFSTLKLQAANTIRPGYKYFGNMFVSTEEFEKIEVVLQDISCKLPESQQGLNFFSFFKLLGHIADISSHYDDKFKTEERVTKWLTKRDHISKLPLFVLAKIWLRVSKTFFQIDKRPENKDKKYHEMFDIYIAGFLNAVYIEIEIYENREYGRKNNSILNKDNVSASSEYFYTKLKNDNRYQEESGAYVLKDTVNDYTFFDYLYECPLLKLDYDYFIILAWVEENQTNTVDDEQSDETVNEKVDFSKLTREEQKEIILGINGWQSYAMVTVANYLRYWLDTKYKNVSVPTLRQIIREMKKEP